MSDSHQVSLIIRGMFDQQQEAVGVDAVGSDAFETGHDMRAMIEILAAIAAKANCMAAQIIGDWDAPEDRKKALFEHFAELKENMLNDMLERANPADPPEEK